MSESRLGERGPGSWSLAEMEEAISREEETLNPEALIYKLADIEVDLIRTQSDGRFLNQAMIKLTQLKKELSTLAKVNR